MTYVHQRMAELWVVQKKRKLSVDEEVEMVHCLQANADYCYKLAALHNQSYMASLTGDIEWQHDLCLEIEKLEYNIIEKKPDTEKRAD